MHVFPVVVVPRVQIDAANPEECLQRIERTHASSSLWHHEIVIDLVARSVTLPVYPVRLPCEAD